MAMSDPITAAIAHIRRITPSNDPWTAGDIAYEAQDPDEIDASIATILNAVATGQLVSRYTLNKLLAEARLAGWRAGRDAAASVIGHYMTSEEDEILCDMWREDILTMPEPKEAGE